uniref:Uncharacterized protein n=1 Tax=Musa balbisiana TaxID=52838 RepID=Q1EP74_MUSBA|nr:hypothetical protein MBP_81C12.4 [Musa balbisiana]
MTMIMEEEVLVHISEFAVRNLGGEVRASSDSNTLCSSDGQQVAWKWFRMLLVEIKKVEQDAVAAPGSVAVIGIRSLRANQRSKESSTSGRKKSGEEEMVVLHPDEVLSRGEGSSDLTRKEGRPMVRPRWLTPRKSSGDEQRQVHWRSPKAQQAKDADGLARGSRAGRSREDIVGVEDRGGGEQDDVGKRLKQRMLMVLEHRIRWRIGSCG